MRDAGRHPPPYTPDIGVTPPVLAGRDDLIADILATLRAGPGHPFFMSALLGHRGVGKTSLLDAVGNRARKQLGWLVVNRQAAPGSDLVADLATSFGKATRLWRGLGRVYRQVAGERVADFTNGAPFSGATLASSSSGIKARGLSLAELVGLMGGFALARSRGILIGIDDTMLARPAELAALASTVRAEVEGSHLPVALIFSGLPSFTTAIGAAEPAFGRGRLATRFLGDLDARATKLALVQPAARFGVSWAQEALDLVASRSAGHPHYIQLYGYRTWVAAKGAKRLGLAHAQAGIRRSDALLGEEFEAIWAGLWPQERFLVSLLASRWGTEPAQVVDIEAAMNPGQPRLHLVRNRLIYHHGLLSSLRRGELGVARPQFAEWVANAHPVGGRAKPARPSARGRRSPDTGQERSSEAVAQTDNPFRPGSGQAPPVLGGRVGVLSVIEAAFKVVASGRYGGATFLLAPAGLGKTALLNYAASQAEQLGWSHLHVSLGSPPPSGTLLAEKARSALSASPRRSGRGAGNDIEAWFGRVAEMAAQRRTGALLTVDDLHRAVRGRRRAWIVPTLDVAAAKAWPLVILATGLPSLTDIIDKYPDLERYNWTPLHMLSEPDSMRALQGAALAAGRRMEDETARLLAQASGGFPYALQVYGFAAWEESRGNDGIGVESAPTAIRTAASELDRALYGPAWRQCSPRERDYLAVVARLSREGVPALGPGVAQKLGSTGHDLSTARAHLIDNDLLMIRSGELEFALPGMVDYVLDRAQPRAQVETTM